MLLVGQLAHSGSPFLATQWSGERLQEGAQLSDQQLRSAETALRRLHAFGYVHADIHAGNLLLNGQQVLFCDLARCRRFTNDHDVNDDFEALAALAGVPA